MRFHVMTIFPKLIESYMQESIMKRAAEKELISVRAWNIRDFSENRHKKTDDYPYGGGAGMVMTPGPIMNCFRRIREEIGGDAGKKTRVIYLTPKGEKLSSQKAVSLAGEEDLILLCGHYEGVDQRVLDRIVTDEISIGDYVLTGGELAALVLIDAVSRQIGGVLGKAESLSEESFSEGYLEYPHYTRPEVFEGERVPSVLLSGDHKKIADWRRYRSLKLTREKRPDLFRAFPLTEEDRALLEKEESEEGKKKQYSAIFFDLDDTLFDFQKSEREALRRVMEDYGLCCDAQALQLYIEINAVLWKLLEEGGVTQEELKVERFRRFLHQIGEDIPPEEMSERYLAHLSSTTYLMKGAEEILRYAGRKYRLALITNGIASVQRSRIDSSSLGAYFDALIISEEVGAAKPAREIFEAAMEVMQIRDRESVLMVGDSLQSDIAGGVAYGIDTCWFRGDKKKSLDVFGADYQISSLLELKKII
ncbi:MAG: tRNA (guanosine(37)-N1)-methyltransferase TrmD [Peptostreptococcaceae bacterium]|nr:tRNA (guanosine(37)-N1)-methyltransferase TrmD [Peptostreptococcaceae bacterium]